MKNSAKPTKPSPTTPWWSRGVLNFSGNLKAKTNSLHSTTCIAGGSINGKNMIIPERSQTTRRHWHSTHKGREHTASGGNATSYSGNQKRRSRTLPLSQKATDLLRLDG